MNKKDPVSLSAKYCQKRALKGHFFALLIIVCSLLSSPALSAPEDLLPQAQESLAVFTHFLYLDFIKSSLDLVSDSGEKGEIKLLLSKSLSIDIDQALLEYAPLSQLFHDLPMFQMFHNTIASLISPLVDEMRLQIHRRQMLLNETGQDEIDFSRYESSLVDHSTNDQNYYEIVNRIYPELKHTVAYSLIEFLKKNDLPQLSPHYDSMIAKQSISDADLYELMIQAKIACASHQDQVDRDEMLRNREDNPWSHMLGNPVSPGLVTAGHMAAAGAVIDLGIGLIYGAPLLIEAGQISAAYGVRFLMTWFRGIQALRKMDIAVCALLAVSYETIVRLDNSHNGLLTDGNFLVNSGEHFANLILWAGGLKALPLTLQKFMPAVVAPLTGYVAIKHYKNKEYYQMGLALALTATISYQGLRSWFPKDSELVGSSSESMESPKVMRFRYHVRPAEEVIQPQSPDVEPNDTYDIYEEAIRALNGGNENELTSPKVFNDSTSKLLSPQSPQAQTQITPMPTQTAGTLASSDSELKSITLTLGQIEITYDPLPLDVTQTLLPYVMDPGVEAPSQDKHRALIARTEQDEDGNTHIVGLEFQDLTSAQLNALLTHPNYSVMDFKVSGKSPSSPNSFEAKKKNGNSNGNGSSRRSSALDLDEQVLNGEFMKLKQSVRDQLIQLYLKFEVPILDLITALKEVKAEFHYPNSFALMMIEEALKQDIKTQDITDYLRERELSLRGSNSTEESAATLSDVNEEAQSDLNEATRSGLIVEESLKSQEPAQSGLFPDTMPLSTSMLDMIDVDALHVTPEFRDEADQALSSKIDELVDRYAISRTSIYVALKGLQDQFGLSLDHAILDLEQFLDAQENGAKSVLTQDESIQAELQLLLPKDKDSARETNSGFRIIGSHRSRQYLRPDNIPADQLEAINTFIKTHERVPFRWSPFKDEEVIAETILDHGGYAEVIPFLLPENQNLPRIRAYVDMGVAAELLNQFIFNHKATPTWTQSKDPENEEKQLYIIMKYHGGEEKIYPYLSDISKNILHEERWLKPIAQLNATVAQIEDWPDSEKKFRELAAFIRRHGKEKLYEYLTPENQQLFYIRQAIVPLEVINEWIESHPNPPRFLQAEIETRALTKEEQQERSIYVAIMTRGGWRAMYHQFTPENQLRVAIRTRWNRELFEQLVNDQPITAFNEYVTYYRTIPYKSNGKAKPFEKPLIAWMETQGGYVDCLRHLTDENRKIAIENHPLMPLYDFVQTHRGHWPNPSMNDPKAEAMMEWINAQPGGSEAVSEHLMKFRRLLARAIPLQVDPKLISTLNVWIPNHQRWPNGQSADPIEKRLANEIADNGHRYSVYTLLSNECHQIFYIRFAVEQIAVINEWMLQSHRWPEQRADTHEERLMAYWIRYNGGQNGIYKRLPLDSQNILEIKMQAAPYLVLSDFLLKYRQWPSRSSDDAQERDLARWSHAQGKQKDIFQKLSEPAKKVFAARLSGEPLTLINEWIASHERWPEVITNDHKKMSQEKLEESILSEWIYNRGGREKIYPMLSPGVKSLFNVRMRVEPEKVMNDFISQHQSMPHQSSSDPDEKALINWMNYHARSKDIYALIAPENQKIFEVRLWGRPYEVFSQFIEKEGRLPDSKSTDPIEKRLATSIQRRGGPKAIFDHLSKEAQKIIK